MSGISNDQLFQDAEQEGTDQCGHRGESPENERSPNAAEKYIIFESEKIRYAVAASNVKEILINQDVFPLPFVPDWIKGLLNYHGEPCAVVDIHAMISAGRNKQTAKTDNYRKSIVLKKKFGGIALQVFEVEQIARIADLDVYPYPDPNHDAVYFDSLVRLGDGEIPSLAVTTIAEAVQKHSGKRI